MAKWRYYQMANFFNKLKPEVRTAGSLTTFENMCVKMAKPNHLLSQMYKLVLSQQKSTIPYFIRDWEKELNYTFTSVQIKKNNRINVYNLYKFQDPRHFIYIYGQMVSYSRWKLLEGM